MRARRIWRDRIQQRPNQPGRSAMPFFFFFAKSCHFVPVTRGKSRQAHLRHAQVGALGEKTAWNLNISDVESLLYAFFPPSLVQILHIYHKEGGALMHLWQGEYHRSQCILENPREDVQNQQTSTRCLLVEQILVLHFPVGNGWQS